MKQLIVFDLDGTLAPSKAPIDAEMATLFTALIEVLKVAIISGGSWAQFETQVLTQLPRDANLRNLSILPTSGTTFYQFTNGWQQLYSEDLSEAQKQRIIAALNAAIGSAGFLPTQTWGETIEDRGSQITYSALGQRAPLDEKSKWDPDFAKRQKIKALLDVALPDFSVRLGGTTSIDITLPGIDKAYGIGKLRDTLCVTVADMIYVGDALFPDGNDYPVRRTGAACIQVRDPNETKRVIEAITDMIT